MRVEHLNPFAESCCAVLEALFGARPARGPLGVKGEIVTSHPINLACDVTGDVAGRVLFAMTQQTADRIAGRLLGDVSVKFTASSPAALVEFCAMVGSHALELLERDGMFCEVAEALVITGRNVRLLGSAPALVIPLSAAPFGALELNVSLQDAREQVA